MAVSRPSRMGYISADALSLSWILYIKSVAQVTPRSKHDHTRLSLRILGFPVATIMGQATKRV